jgi:short chain dehydrogenase
VAQFQSGSWNGLEPLDARRSLANEVGEVDMLVNNGGFSWFGATDQLDTDTYDRLFASNVRSPYQLVAVLTPRMAKAGRGSIISVDSTAGRVGLDAAPPTEARYRIELAEATDMPGHPANCDDGLVSGWLSRKFTVMSLGGGTGNRVEKGPQLTDQRVKRGQVPSDPGQDDRPLKGGDDHDGKIVSPLGGNAKLDQTLRERLEPTVECTTEHLA